MKPRQSGISRLIKSAHYSWRGLCSGWRSEQAFRLEVVLAILCFPATFWLANSFLGWLMLLGSALLVIITELINSAVEATVDRIGSEFHELSGRAKDLGSAAVFVSALFAAVVWGGFLLARLGILPIAG